MINGIGDRSITWPYRRNIVGQQLPTSLDVTCCVRLLCVVGSCCANIVRPTMLGVVASVCT